LFELHPDVDKEYLDRRIREETMGEYEIGTALGTTA
jgi:hypothetical protein